MNNTFLEYNNFDSFFTNMTKTKLRMLLETNGWTIRKESWADFECTNEWSNLHLVADESAPLLNGAIADPETNYPKLVEMFYNIQAKFQAELYDKEKVMLRCDKNL